MPEFPEVEAWRRQLDPDVKRYPIAQAMRARPDLVGGKGADDTALMQLRPGFVAKRGAEGLLCAVGPDGRGYAFKVEDGNGRALRPALGAVLELEQLARVEVRNSLGAVVGEIAAA